MPEDEAGAELARLRSELDEARRYASEQERRADALDAQYSQAGRRVASAQVAQLSAQETAAKENLAALDAQIASLKQQKVAALGEGKFSEVTDLDEQLTNAAARRLMLHEAVGHYGAQRTQIEAQPTDPVERFLVDNDGVFSEADKAWIRQNRRYATDDGFRQRVIAAHGEAVAEGRVRPGSAEYYAYLTQRGYGRPQQAASRSQPLPSGEGGAAEAGEDVDGGEAAGAAEAGNTNAAPEIIIAPARREGTLSDPQGAFGRRAEHPQPSAAGRGSLRQAAAAPTRRAVDAPGRRTILELTPGERETALSLAPHLAPDEVRAGGEPAILQWYHELKESPAARRMKENWSG